MAGEDPGGRIFTGLAAILGWGVLWFVSVFVGYEIGIRMVDPMGRDGYAAASGLLGVLLISPLALLASIVVLLVIKRRVLLFILSAVPTGLAITLWPLLEWLFPWATW